MSNIDRMPEIIEKYGEAYMLRQLAEECAELAQAALKLIRAYRMETPMRVDEARERLIEEIADVQVMSDAIYAHMMNDEEQSCVMNLQEIKEQRMYLRMLDGEMDENIW